MSRHNHQMKIDAESRHWLLRLALWVPTTAAVGLLAGTSSALLLWSLDEATKLRESHPWLIALLAPAGLLVGLIYHYRGRTVEGGSNLVLETIHAEADDPRTTLPARMAPLILMGTFLTHLFGGSAGREGTAVQAAASLADQLSGPLRLRFHDRRLLLMAGMSAGFGSVFGTPLAGAVFGFEVLAAGHFSFDALIPCLLASYAGDYVTRAWQIHHTVYVVPFVPTLSLRGTLMAIAAGIAFGLTAMFFARLTHGIGQVFKRWIAFPPFRPAVGGLLVSLAVAAVGTTRYIGLGVPTIVASFHERLRPWDWAAKLGFTALTLGAGFKGGEVTPLFYIGSTLGNALSGVLSLPAPLLAGMGFAAVFGGAAKTPIAATVMAAELFGVEAGAYAGIACAISYVVSGDHGIYHAQRSGSRFGRVQRT